MSRAVIFDAYFFLSVPKGMNDLNAFTFSKKKKDATLICILQNCSIRNFGRVMLKYAA